MLQNIRDHLQGTIAKGIIVLFTIPFALFGIEAFFHNGEPEVARVNGESIKERDLEVAMELQRRQLVARMGDKIDPALLEKAALRKSVVDALIDRALLEQLAASSRLHVSEASIDSLIVGDQAFQDGGKFSQPRYQALLASNGITPVLHRKLLREELLISQVIDGLFGSEFVTPRELADVSRITQQAVDVRYLVVPLPSPDAIVVPDADVSAYFEKNRDRFRAEETVAVEYLELRLENLFQPVPEDKLRAEYESRIGSFVAKDERHAAHIQLSNVGDAEAKEKLGKLRERALAGEDFAALAKANSSDAGSAAAGGDVGYSSGDIFPPEFEAALAALKPGEISPPVKTSAGWHIVKLLDTRKQDIPPFEEMRDRIEHDLQQQAAEPLFQRAKDRLGDLTFNSAGLDDAARELQLQKQSSEPFGRSGAAGLFADKRLVDAAFSPDVLTDGQNSEVIELAPNHVVVLHVREHHEARQRDLVEVREQIVTELRNTLQRRQAQARAGELLARLRAGTGVEALARGESLEWQVALQHRRGAPGLDDALDVAAFSLPRTGASAQGSVAREDGAVYVFEVTNFHEGTVDALPREQQLALSQAYRQAKARDTLAQYQKQLRDYATIELR